VRALVCVCPRHVRPCVRRCTLFLPARGQHLETTRPREDWTDASGADVVLDYYHPLGGEGTGACLGCGSRRVRRRVTPFKTMFFGPGRPECAATDRETARLLAPRRLPKTSARRRDEALLECMPPLFDGAGRPQTLLRTPELLREPEEHVRDEMEAADEAVPRPGEDAENLVQRYMRRAAAYLQTPQLRFHRYV